MSIMVCVCRANAAIASTTGPRGKPVTQLDESALVRETQQVLQLTRPAPVQVTTLFECS